MKVAVVGVTGLVGTKMLEVLEERGFPVTELIPVASSRSIGKQISFQGKDYTVVSMEDAIARKPDIALFSAGGLTSTIEAPKFAAVGTCVIDNSSAWRMDPSVKLIVPEVNGAILTGNEKIIANPNCSTIQLVVALAPLHRKFGIERLVISTYQSPSGTGKKAIDQYNSEKRSEVLDKEEMAYPHQIFDNCIPHCDVFLENNYTKEEMKLVQETRKIIGDQDIRITATAVRVPVLGGHSESVNVELANEFEMGDVINVIREAEGVEVVDDLANASYPMPLNANETDAVYVGRIRRDESHDRALNCWIVSDNLRKGAATNAVQIAERMAKIWNN